MTRPPTEILVHIAAASSASDDVRYRTLAQAYADYEPAARVNVGTVSFVKDSVGSVDKASRVGSSGEPAHVVSFEEYRQPVSSTAIDGQIADSQSLRSVSLSFESVWDNVTSPGVVPVPLPVPPPRPEVHKRHLHYVSPNDYIPDSQSGDERRTRRRRMTDREDKNSTALSERVFGVSRVEETRIEETQDLLSSRVTDNHTIAGDIRIHAAASPDLSTMHLDVAHLTDRVLGDSQDWLPSHRGRPQRLALGQRSANSQQSPRNEDNDTFLKRSPPLHEWDAIPSSAPGSSPDLGAGQPVGLGVDVPSSLPEESGKVVLTVASSSCEQLGLSAGLSSSVVSGVSGLLRADSEPIRTKRQRESDHESIRTSGLDHKKQNLHARRASDIGQPSPKKVRGDLVFEAGSSIASPGKTGTAMNVPNGTLRDLSQPFPSSSPTASAPGLYLDQTVRIISPDPPVSCEHLDPAALVTDKMAKLASDLDLERRYRPSPSPDSRAVRPFERGYWRLSTASWPATVRQQAWSFLKTYIGAGDAGWSVWCSRDPAPHTWLRLSCFAATAGHTYLILYLASQRHILATGAVWLDASGTPTITVPPRKRKQTSGSADVFTNTY
ncbi:uncharacterized protein SPSK_08912 [Sporothrix schenckii 1099-18]|uniref:Uncharacterized protein n=1 Tax=Sporothrix schenckii 1099-18 TaxID=1397361 RepID=A0A0F2M3Y5_SPOSC|nr:uncharacterized protein SPSK_08912 [Sporothrix schenckii 1099-18]KJR84418.1 hypothetical protein SPSK_08912 [Sporothrix schenckii 1099-18]